LGLRQPSPSLPTRHSCGNPQPSHTVIPGPPGTTAPPSPLYLAADSRVLSRHCEHGSLNGAQSCQSATPPGESWDLLLDPRIPFLPFVVHVYAGCSGERLIPACLSAEFGWAAALPLPTAPFLPRCIVSAELAADAN
jgi:hypothetical protein